ncbi:putative ribosomal-protein-alanine acetyltransferase [Panicum miliaceum]|uniref:Ribosomal-protein-alanine acetyltransferase n=1 Tax=Panicum miliaceum TaxID=4540 RepID=A0A3L6SE13_PANMI|nr:putative ribosomal-protein-alanine acetyltransferase [Panicum miliaceum]
MAAAAILDLDPTHVRAGRVLEDIVRLEQMIFPEHASPARSLRDELKRRNFGLVYSTPGAGGEEVAGYAVYTCNTSLCATIIELAVRESCRRQGDGEALLRAAVERCRGRRVQRVILHVDPARTAAVALYRKAGFQVDATVEGYYAPQRDAYRMFMDLQ